jgi:hypothetical protein
MSQLEQITLHLGELGKSSPFLDTKSSNVYVVLVSRGEEAEMLTEDAETLEDLPLEKGAAQLARELRDQWDNQGVAGDFQIAGRFRPGCEVFEHIDPRGGSDEP